MPHLGVGAETFLNIEAFLQLLYLFFQHGNSRFLAFLLAANCLVLPVPSLAARRIAKLFLVRPLFLCLNKWRTTVFTICSLSNINHDVSCLLSSLQMYVTME